MLGGTEQTRFLPVETGAGFPVLSTQVTELAATGGARHMETSLLTNISSFIHCHS
jgi:hypothetical protein